jgi:hypothetical protein
MRPEAMRPRPFETERIPKARIGTISPANPEETYANGTISVNDKCLSRWCTMVACYAVFMNFSPGWCPDRHGKLSKLGYRPGLARWEPLVEAGAALPLLCWKKAISNICGTGLVRNSRG